MPETTLEPIAPDEAVRLYLRNRQNELSDATMDSYRYKLEKFVEWCEAEDVENLNSLSGRDLLRFEQYRAQDLNSVSLKGQLDALRALVKWCEANEKEDGTEGVWAECPECSDVVAPE